MTFGSLFSGIGGIDLGLERAGWHCKWMVENDPYCNQILAKHWPEVTRYGDIRTVRGSDLEPVDCIAGGFPCQDLSQAGKRIGIEGARSGLWFEFARLVGELRPRYVLVENVPGLLVSDAMRRVVGELARLGYVGCWRSLRASEFGASHLRKRVFIVAYRERLDSERRGNSRDMGSTAPVEPREGLQRQWAGYAANDCSDYLAHGEHEGRLLSGASHHGNGSDASGDHVNGCDPDVDDTATPRWSGRAENSRGVGAGPCVGQGGLLQSEHGCDSLGHSQRARWAQAGIGCDEHAGGEPEAGRGMLGDFAPGPSDSRWPGILRERPDLAPALANAKPIRASRDSGAVGEPGETESRESKACGSAATPEHSSADAFGQSSPSESPFRGVAPGISDQLDRAMSDRTKRLGRLGNSVVPQVAEWVGRRINEFESGEMVRADSQVGEGTLHRSLWRTPQFCSENSLRGSGQDPELRKAQGHNVTLSDQACYWGVEKL